MIAQEVVQAESEATKYYNLMVEEEATDTEGNTVTIMKVTEKVCLEDLNNRKEGLTAQIAEIDSKIDAIGELSN